MSAVQEILSRKTHSAVIVDIAQSIQDVAREMAQCRAGAAAVVGGSGAIIGIVTEDEILLAMTGPAADLPRRQVRDYMSSRLVFCSTHNSDIELMEIMAREGLRHLLVMIEGRLAGLISLDEVVRYRIDALNAAVAEFSRIAEELGSREHQPFTRHLHGHAGAAARPCEIRPRRQLYS